MSKAPQKAHLKTLLLANTTALVAEKALKEGELSHRTAYSRFPACRAMPK
jgi:hypothetical protein